MKKQLIAISAMSLCLATTAFAEEEVKKGLTLDGEFGLILTTGNTETTSSKAKLSAKQELDSWSNEYLIEGLYKKDTVETDDVEVETTSAESIFASAQGNYKLENPDHRLFIFGSYEDDRFSNFKYQGTIAAGWNQKLWGNDDSSFDYSIGPGYSFAETQSGEDNDGFIVRGAFNYSKTISETAVFTQTFSTEIGADNTKSRAESALSAKIAGNLSIKLSLNLDHNSDVDEGVDNLDTETAVTLVYSFF